MQSSPFVEWSLRALSNLHAAPFETRTRFDMVRIQLARTHIEHGIAPRSSLQVVSTPFAALRRHTRGNVAAASERKEGPQGVHHFLRYRACPQPAVTTCFSGTFLRCIGLLEHMRQNLLPLYLCVPAPHAQHARCRHDHGTFVLAPSPQIETSLTVSMSTALRRQYRSTWCVFACLGKSAGN